VTPPLRVAVVGCGAVARHAHVPAWLANADARITALCDPDTGAAKALAAKHDLKCAIHASLDELLAENRPDVVDLCTPGFLHFEQARAALAAGCSVLVEKPPVRSVAQGEELVALAAAKGVKLGAVFNYRYRDLVQQLKGVADAGTLGAVVKVHITHHAPLVFTDAPWLWDEPRSKYILWEFGIHFIDILVYLLGPHEKLLHVEPFLRAEIGHTTDLEVLIQFAGGAVGRLEITQDSLRHSTSLTRIEAFGSGMDAFVRWFPPSLRLSSGQVNPADLIWSELKSAWNLGMQILTGQFLKQRNISHYRTINAYTDWLLGRSDYSQEFRKILPTLRLLEAIEARIPSYQSA
jgi:predicted dehydrogenase